MEQTFLFYDIETTGLSKPFDQVLQFAAIRTDDQLQEISRHSFYVQLSADVIPDPQALMTHQISWAKLQEGVTECDAILQIHELLNTPGTISLGYNTLGFDDEFLRFSFYRYLLSPYTHQYANGCGRADLYPMMILFYLYKRQSLQWPKLEKGRVSMKLEHLAKANGIQVGQAHDAMNDVIATLELARKLFAYQDMWQYALGYFNKKEEQKRVADLVASVEVDGVMYKQALYLDGALGYNQAFQVPVLLLGEHQVYRNQTLWLRLDSGDLTTTDADSVATVPYVIRKKYAEQGFLLPMKERFLKELLPDRGRLVAENLAWCRQQPKLLRSIAEYHLNYEYPVQPDCDIDAALYQVGFKSYAEERLCQKFVTAPLVEKVRLLEKLEGGLKEQARRLIWRINPSVLSENDQQALDAFVNAIEGHDKPRVDFRGHLQRQPAEVCKALLDCMNTLESGDSDKKAVLLGWQEALQSRFSVLTNEGS